ncbi:site-specific DNA-methyltransferase [Enterococcus faecalis]|nr:site-specific DNA-methyltransferase [Enterococcus faecalis]MCM6874048.1 site-specific DNA-methyltransferase [Enterococcus faecalis]
MKLFWIVSLVQVTAVAAINTNRQFVGFEKEKEYFDVAIERIEKASEEDE